MAVTILTQADKGLKPLSTFSQGPSCQALRVKASSRRHFHSMIRLWVAHGRPMLPLPWAEKLVLGKERRCSVFSSGMNGGVFPGAD